MSRFHNLDESFTVESDTCHYQNDAIVSDYTYVWKVLMNSPFFCNGINLSFLYIIPLLFL